MDITDETEHRPAQPDRLEAARSAIREGDFARAQALALDSLPDHDLADIEAETHVQTLHLLADTMIAAGLYDDAQHILEDALGLARDTLDSDALSTRLEQSLLHITLADLALQTSDQLRDNDFMKAEVYAHTSAALSLLVDQPSWGAAIHSARFFAYRTVMMASLIQNDSGTARFARMQMRNQHHGDLLPEHVNAYYDLAMMMADAYLEPDESPTVEVTSPLGVPPLSSYVALRTS